MEEHFNVAFPSSPPTSDYTIDFFFLPTPTPPFPTSGSCYSSNNNLSWLLVPLQRSCRENQRKSAVFYDLWRLFDLRLLEGSTDVMPPSEMDYELCSALGWRRQLLREDGRVEAQLIGKQTASASIGGERTQRLGSHVSVKSPQRGFNQRVALGKIWPVIPFTVISHCA